jgi:diguanylate cyclase (GGDEF)-like protein
MDYRDKEITSSDKDASSQPSSRIITNPIHLFIIIAISIFLTEAMIMFILSILPPLPIYQIALLDGFLLIAIVFPLLYVFLLKPYITERYRMDEKLYTLSITDELTGLYNRRGFFALAEQQLKMSKRLKRDALLLSADMDNLKEINDTLGHKEGDLALIDTANILRESFRESDIIARIGGDEFVVLQIENIDVDSNMLTNRLQNNLEIHNTSRNKKLSVSIGIIRCEPECPYSIEELLIEADKLMYKQKRNKQKL